MVYLLSVLSCTKLCSYGSRDTGYGCYIPGCGSTSITYFTGLAQSTSCVAVYTSRYLVSETGTQSIQFQIAAGSNTNTITPIVSLSVADKTYDSSGFEVIEVSTSSSHYINATFTDYLFKGTYIYFNFTYSGCSNCGNYVKYALPGSDFVVMKGTELEPYWKGDDCAACEDSSLNPGQMCMPVTYSAVSNFLFNDVARKSLVLGSLFALLS